MPNREQLAQTVESGPSAHRPSWKTPLLSTIGDLQTVTRAIDNSGRNDGGSGGMKRT
jgi:hypothetical protein